MPDNRFPNTQSLQSNQRETVCIETNCVLDCCRDRDCFENVKVFLSDFGNDIIERTSNIRVSKCEIVGANISIERVNFNRGFYTVNIRLYILLSCEACMGMGHSQDFHGIAVVDKKVVLYGGESNLNIFRANGNGSFCEMADNFTSSNTPEVGFEAVDPVILSANVCEPIIPWWCPCSIKDLPQNVCTLVNGTLSDTSPSGKYLAVSIGLFSVVKITRPGQYLVSATEYNVPDKECVPENDTSPCDLFSTMPFPTNEFSAGSPINTQKEKHCGLCNK